MIPYDAEFLRNVPDPNSRDRRPLVNLKANYPWLLERFNEWYRDLLPEGDPDLRARLRDVNNSTNFLGAFWELVILRYLREAGYDVLYNAQVCGKTPDLFWNRQDFIGDVVAISDPHFSAAEQAHIDNLVRLIDGERFPFDVSIIRFEFVSDRNPRLSRIVGWLRGLRDASAEDLYGRSQEYEAEDARIGVLLSPRTQGRQVKAVGMFSLDAEQLKRIIKGRLQQKVRTYQRPLVVFVGTGLGFWPVDDDTLHMSLYGNWLVHFSRVPGKTASGPDTAANGVFYNRMGTDGRPANTELSAIILASWRVKDQQFIVRLGAYHNPEASRPLSREFFSPMPQFLVTSENGGECKLEWVDKNEGFILGDPIPATPTR